jgi:hypothetical protein
LDNSDEEASDSLKAKWKKQPEQKERPWLPISVDGYTFYATPKTIHIFLLHDEAPVEKNFNPKLYNDRAIAALLNLIRSTVPEKINLLNSVLKESQRILLKYVRDWSQYRMRLDKSYDTHRILPAMKIENATKDQQKEENWEEEDNFDYDDDFWDTPFRLPKIKFTDTGIISGSWHELQVRIDNFMNCAYTLK